MPSEDQNLGIVRDGFRARALGQGYLGISIRNQILLKRGHARIQCFGVLSLRLPCRAQQNNSAKLFALIVPRIFRFIDFSRDTGFFLGNIR